MQTGAFLLGDVGVDSVNMNILEANLATAVPGLLKTTTGVVGRQAGP